MTWQKANQGILEIIKKVYRFRLKLLILQFCIYKPTSTEPKPPMPKIRYPRNTTLKERRAIVEKQKKGSLKEGQFTMLGRGPMILFGKCACNHGPNDYCVYCLWNICKHPGCMVFIRCGGWQNNCNIHPVLPTIDEEEEEELPASNGERQDVATSAEESQDTATSAEPSGERQATSADDADDEGDNNDEGQVDDDEDQDDVDQCINESVDDQPYESDDDDEATTHIWISAEASKIDDEEIIKDDAGIIYATDNTPISPESPSNNTPVTPESPSVYAKRRRVFVAPTNWTDEALYRIERGQEYDWACFLLRASQITDVAEFPRGQYDLNIVEPPFIPLNIQCFRNQNAPQLQFFITSLKLAYMRNEERVDSNKWSEPTVKGFIDNGASDQELMDYVTGITDSNELFSFVMYGGTYEALASICKHGFTNTDSGISFSNAMWIPLAHAEPDDGGFHNIVIAIILAGKRTTNPENDDFDSGGDMDDRRGQIYTVYREHQAFPLYWVRFQK